MAGKDSNPGQREGAKLRRQQALSLRVGGATYQQIATRIKVSLAQAHADVQRELEETAHKHEEDREEIRRIEVERLDAMHTGLWAKAQEGQPYAVDRVLRIMERRAKLLGLDAPKRKDHHIESLGRFTLALGRGDDDEEEEEDE